MTPSPEDTFMPDEIYVYSDPSSIGDYGFTTIEKEEGYTRYVRADKPADNGGEVDRLKAKIEELENELLEFKERM